MGILLSVAMVGLVLLMIAPFALPDSFLSGGTQNVETIEDRIQVCQHSLEDQRFALRTATVKGRPGSMGSLLGLSAEVVIQVPETGFQAEINFANWTCENVEGWPAWVEFEEGYPKKFPVMSTPEKT